LLSDDREPSRKDEGRGTSQFITAWRGVKEANEGKRERNWPERHLLETKRGGPMS